jgi:hypothetical protein
MKTYVFGYGSLVNPESAAKTLGRKLYDKDVSLVEIKNYTRSWGLVVEVILYYRGDGKSINAAFLDIQKIDGKSANGVLIEVNKGKLEKFDKREKYYDRVDVTDDINPRPQEGNVVYTYVGKSAFLARNYRNVKVLHEYQKIVDQGIQHWGQAFCDRFNLTTAAHEFEIVTGTYIFPDCKQD